MDLLENSAVRDCHFIFFGLQLGEPVSNGKREREEC
jgi:hypothetical protein